MNIIQKLLLLVDNVTNNRYNPHRWDGEWKEKAYLIKEDWRMVDKYHMTKIKHRNNKGVNKI